MRNSSGEVSEALSTQALEIAKKTIHPIVEFFPIDLEGKNENEFIDTSIDNKDRIELRKALSASKGIYAFYNSEYECIYIGKTKNNLWLEMKTAYNREMNHYQRFTVDHGKKQKYKVPSNGILRPIRARKFHLYDNARYFSAYHIEENDLVDLMELMIVRLMPNDLLNVRMEGNTSLIPTGANR